MSEKKDDMKNLDRREFVGITSGAAAGAMLTPWSCESKEKKAKKNDKPNLVYVFADQLGARHIGMASERAKTPVLDNMAKEGVNFTNAVSTMPVCCAHRASLMTGKYPTTTGMVINELRMNPDHECIGHVLTKAGYHTGYIGKWHLYSNELGDHMDPDNSFVPPGKHRLGFNDYFAAYNFHHNYYGAYYHLDTPEKIPYSEKNNLKAYEPLYQTNMAIDFIKKAAESPEPFALFLSWGPPHDPWVLDNVPTKFYEKFDDTEFPRPPNFSWKNDKYADPWGQLLPGQRLLIEHWKRIYYGMTASLDWNLGRILSALDEQGLSDNTLVVFSSDHGEMFGAHGRRAKNIFYEEAARVPFLMRFPGRIPAGREVDACLGTVDIMPTLLGLLGLPIPGEVEGTDLSSVAQGENGAEPEAAFLQNLGACAEFLDGYEWRAVRDKRYTYAVYRRDGHELLFDNINDPFQQKNLASEKEHAKTKKRLKEFMKDKMESLNDNFEKCTWYRDHWIKDRIILRGAKG
ncbi:MAG: sulfatase [bacterium]